MQNSLKRLGQFLHRVFFEVPGWPGAPRWVRFRRALPVFVPAALALLLVAASELVHKPRMDAVRARHAGLLQTEAELATLRLSWSDQSARELEQRAGALASRLLPSAREADEFLSRFVPELETLGWDVRFQAYDSPGAATGGESLVVWAPALLRMKALPENDAPLASLFEAVDRLRSAGPRLDVGRLSMSVNEQKDPFVEMNLRIACAERDEKASE